MDAKQVEKAQNVQDVFLNHLRESKTPVTIFLMNGDRCLVRQLLDAAAPCRPFAACLQVHDLDHLADGASAAVRRR